MPKADLRAAREAAEEFRSEHITGQPWDKFPLDTVFIADVCLKLDFIPFPHLSRDYNTEAAITRDMRSLYVDESAYSHYDDSRSPAHRKNRLRFSVAHEIGHLKMHAHLACRYQSFGDMRDWFKSANGQITELEMEANEFAGRLILPLKVLKSAIEIFGNNKSSAHWRSSAELRNTFATDVGKRVGLHVQGVLTRLDREYVWPSDWVSGG